MRSGSLLLVAVAALGMAACAPKSSAQPMGDGELVLELGAGNRSFAASLRSLGVTLLPPRRVDEVQVPDEPAPQPTDGGGDERAPTGRDGMDKPLVPQPPPVDPEYLEVTLQPKQKLQDLAKKHLGSSARYVDILKANGWTEADARKLPAGKKVRIPKPPKQG